MQGPWRIFLIQSESEKEISLLLLCTEHEIKAVCLNLSIMACLSFPIFCTMMHLANVFWQQACQYLIQIKNTKKRACKIYFKKLNINKNIDKIKIQTMAC